MRRTLGLDVGTTALKGVLVDEYGRTLAEASRSYATSEPAPGWTEQDPEDWWQAAAEVTRAQLARYGNVDAAGLSGPEVAPLMHELASVERDALATGRTRPMQRAVG